MKKALILIAAVLAVISVPVTAASAREGKTIACYEKLLKPAKYRVKKELVEPVKRQYEWHGGLYKLVEYPAIYREIREELEPEYYLLREVPCKKSKRRK